MDDQLLHAATAREAAYLALLYSYRGIGFISSHLEAWKAQRNPKENDFNLALEIAYGSCRMALALDYIAKQLAEGCLNLKRKERLLLHTALYQRYFMTRIPAYALTNETVAIASKHCHSRFANFLNVLLRKAAASEIHLPNDDASASLSIRYSLPLYFVEELLAEYGLESAKKIMNASNQTPPLMARARKPAAEPPLGTRIFAHSTLPMLLIEDRTVLPSIAQAEEFYIQNATPAALVSLLAEKSFFPKTILDLCAAPGGKLLLAHDLYPNAQLFANDLTEDKIKKLRENLSKYHIEAAIQCGPGELYPAAQHFDLIILDLPCSNSGVLNKRPEARWRLNKEAIEKLEQTQSRLVEHAITLLNPGGQLWYMTCSILKSENEKLIASIAQKHRLEITLMKTILPDDQGFDGGFAAALRTQNSQQ